MFTLRSRELGAGKLGPSIGNASPQMHPRGCNRARKASTAGSASPWSTCAITDMVRICFGFGLSTTVGSCVDVKFTCSKRCAWVKPGHPITACACGTPAQRPRRNRFAPAPPPRPHTPSCHACRESRVCRGGVLVSGLHNLYVLEIGIFDNPRMNRCFQQFSYMMEILSVKVKSSIYILNPKTKLKQNFLPLQSLRGPCTRAVKMVRGRAHTPLHALWRCRASGARWLNLPRSRRQSFRAVPEAGATGGPAKATARA